MVDVVAITPTIWMLRFPVVNAYVVRVGSGYALVDTGPRGAFPAVVGSVAAIDDTAAPSIRSIVLTHSHKDHTGSAAALVAATGAEVIAGARDAPVIAGNVAELEAVITSEERPIFDRIPPLPPAPPVRVDRVVRDGDELDWGSTRAVVIDAPGHTPGSIAIHLPAERVLFTGDNVASFAQRAVLGPFNVVRDDAIASFHRLAALDIDIACFGHGDPILGDAQHALRATTATL